MENNKQNYFFIYIYNMKLHVENHKKIIIANKWFSMLAHYKTNMQNKFYFSTFTMGMKK